MLTTVTENNNIYNYSNILSHFDYFNYNLITNPKKLESYKRVFDAYKIESL